MGSHLKVLTGFILLILCTSCSTHSIVGRWNCDEYMEDYDLLVITGKSDLEYFQANRLIVQTKYSYDFKGKGYMRVTVEMPGSYSWLDGSLVEIQEQIKLVDLESDMGISREAALQILSKSFPTGRVSEYEVEFLTPRRIRFNQMGDDDPSVCSRA